MEKIKCMSSELKSPAFQFYAQDFLTGIMYLTNEEVGIYIKILAKQWTDGPIPKKRVGLLVGLDWDKFSEELKEKFQDNGDTLVNLRLEKERVKKSKFLNKQKINGSKGGRPKKEDTQNNPSVIKNKTQKKPLEEEVEYEIEIENKEVIKKGIDLKIENETLKKSVQEFLEHRKTNRSPIKTQMQYDKWLAKLQKDSGNNPVKAIEMIDNSIANGWKGIFKTDSNAKPKDTRKSAAELDREHMGVEMNNTNFLNE